MKSTDNAAVRFIKLKTAVESRFLAGTTYRGLSAVSKKDLGLDTADKPRYVGSIFITKRYVGSIFITKKMTMKILVTLSKLICYSRKSRSTAVFKVK